MKTMSAKALALAAVQLPRSRPISLQALEKHTHLSIVDPAVSSCLFPVVLVVLVASVVCSYESSCLGLAHGHKLAIELFPAWMDECNHFSTPVSITQTEETG